MGSHGRSPSFAICACLRIDVHPICIHALPWPRALDQVQLRIRARAADCSTTLTVCKTGAPERNRAHPHVLTDAKALRRGHACEHHSSEKVEASPVLWPNMLQPKAMYTACDSCFVCRSSKPASNILFSAVSHKIPRQIMGERTIA